MDLILVRTIPHTYTSPLSVDDTTGITQDGRQVSSEIS